MSDYSATVCWIVGLFVLCLWPLVAIFVYGLYKDSP